MLSSDWSRMDSCPASNTMYYNIGSKGKIVGEGKRGQGGRGRERGKKRIGSRMIRKEREKTATMAFDAP